MLDRQRSRRFRVKDGSVVAIVLAAVVACASPVASQSFGVQGSWAQDAAGLLWGDGVSTQLGVGGRLELPVSSLRAVGSLDYFFPDCDDLRGGAESCKYWEFNADLAIPIGSSGFNPYLGGGLTLGATSVTGFVDDVNGPTSATTTTSNTEVGLNILAGLRRSVGSVVTYAEARVEIGGGEQFVLSTGFLLGG